MTRTLQLPDVRRVLGGLERRLGILERRITAGSAPTPTNGDIIFSYAGTLVAGSESPPTKIRYTGTIHTLAVALGTAGSSSTTLKIWKNGLVAATVVVPSGSADYGPTVGVSVTAEDRLSIEVDVAGTGAADLTATARFT